MACKLMLSDKFVEEINHCIPKQAVQVG